MDTVILKDLADRATFDGVVVFGVAMKYFHGSYLIQIELDDLNHPLGAVTLEQCERFSKSFIEVINAAIDSFFENGELPEDLTIDNYSLEVSSAGAEREIRIPDEFERFRGRALKIRYRTNDETIRVEHGIFDSLEEGLVKFIGFKPKSQKKVKPNPFQLELSNIVKINLYLDV
ncbi:MAG: hypothetical protein H3C43_01815 [Leptonema sp. (in: Bacteria)]|nr:hypothetical protein [Leptonema sp. (in: bacteria)]